MCATAGDAARLGEPSYVWRAGQERRLRMIQQAAEGRERGWLLDNGCGLGLYLQRLAADAEHAIGVELDRERARAAGRNGLAVVTAAAEHLPFPDGVFDLALSHEVLEHVADDRAALAEMVRTLRPPPSSGTVQPVPAPRSATAGRNVRPPRDPSTTKAGRLVLFTPNRGYPFETHGVYWKGRYRFGNIPLVNYLPGALRNRLAPHVRTYSGRDMQRLMEGLPVRVVQRTMIAGAYDNLIARWKAAGRALRALMQFLERNPLRAFGLSHYWVVEKT